MPTFSLSLYQEPSEPATEDEPYTERSPAELSDPLRANRRDWLMTRKQDKCECQVGEKPRG